MIDRPAPTAELSATDGASKRSSDRRRAGPVGPWPPRTAHAAPTGAAKCRIAGPFGRRLQRLLLWRVWERMLEIEFVDRSVALAGKAFVSFFPLVIVVAAFAPERIRSSIITAVTARLGIRGDALAARQGSVRVVGRRPAGDRPARSGAHDLLRQLVHDRACSACTSARGGDRTAPGVAVYWRGWSACCSSCSCMALLGGLRGALDGGLGVGLFAVVCAGGARQRCGGSPRGSSCWARCGRGCCSRPG